MVYQRLHYTLTPCHLASGRPALSNVEKHRDQIEALKPQPSIPYLRDIKLWNYYFCEEKIDEKSNFFYQDKFHSDENGSLIIL